MEKLRACRICDTGKATVLRSGGTIRIKCARCDHSSRVYWTRNPLGLERAMWSWNHGQRVVLNGKFRRISTARQHYRESTSLFFA